MPIDGNTLEIPSSCRLIRDGKYQGWIEMPRFALIDAHTYLHEKKAGEGEEVEKIPVTLDAENLQRIADTCNARIKRTGDYCPCVIGHTKDDLPTKFQPEIVGLAKDFSVEPFVNDETGLPVVRDGKPVLAIYATPFCESKHLEDFLKHPRRSVELYFDEGVIDPISLLSSETPARDLGLHKFGANQKAHREKPYRYAINSQPDQSPEPIMADEIKDDMDKDTASIEESSGDEAEVNKVFESSRFKELEAQVGEMKSALSDIKSMLEQVVGGEPEGGEPEDLFGEDGQHDEPDGDEPGMMDHPGEEFDPNDLQLDDEHGEPDGDEGEPKKMNSHCEPDRMSAGSGPGAMNSYMPGGAKKMSREQRAIQESRQTQEKSKFAKLEQELRQTKARLSEIEEEKKIAEVKAILAGLDAEGVGYDPEIELPRMVRFSKKEREAHVAYLRKWHRPATPGNGQFPVPEQAQAVVKFSKGTSPEAVDPFTPRDVNEAQEAARQSVIQGKPLRDVIAAMRGMPGATSVTQTK